MNDKYCVLQDDLKDCGVCSLLSIIKYYDGSVSKEYLRELTKTNKNGVSALNLLRAARELGFEAYGIKGKLKDIKNDYLPIIAHVTIDKKYNHFVVIYKIDIKKNKVLLMDPKKGFIFLSFSNFVSISTNYFLVLKKKQVIPKLVEKNSFMSNFFNIVKDYRIVLWVIIIMSLAYIVINTINSYSFKLLFDEVMLTTSSDLYKIFIVLLALIIFKCLIHLFRMLLINKLNYIVDQKIVSNAFYHIINLPYLYYKNHTNGDLLTRINDLGNIKELISNFFINVLVDVMLALVIIIVMFNINSSLSLIITITLVLYTIVTIVSNKIILHNVRDNYEKSSIVNNYLVEALASFETIKNLSLQKYICNNFNKKYNDYNQNKEMLLQKNNITNCIKGNILFIGELLVLYFGIKYLKNNNLSVSLLITFITLSNYLVEPVKNALELSLLYLSSKESIHRIKEIYNIPNENMLMDKKMYINNLRGRICINNLTYSYNGVDNVIKNISMDIVDGEKVLIYGNSGCGKSTLMQLLIKYLDNNYSGDIAIDGYDLRKIDFYSLRKNICYVSQNEFLYTDSILNNITLGRRVNYKDVLNMSKNLYIDEIVKNSNLGYNYLIENNGENISGGEKMRILIARSLIGKYNTYIYDETFSAIDIRMERKILSYIFELYKGKTFIVVSHRKSNIDLFDRVVYLENHE